MRQGTLNKQKMDEEPFCFKPTICHFSKNIYHWFFLNGK